MKASWKFAVLGERKVCIFYPKKPSTIYLGFLVLERLETKKKTEWFPFIAVLEQRLKSKWQDRNRPERWMNRKKKGNLHGNSKARLNHDCVNWMLNELTVYWSSVCKSTKKYLRILNVREGVDSRRMKNKTYTS